MMIMISFALHFPGKSTRVALNRFKVKRRFFSVKKEVIGRRSILVSENLESAREQKSRGPFHLFSSYITLFAHYE